MQSWHVHLSVSAGHKTGERFEWHGHSFQSIQPNHQHADCFSVEFETYCQLLDAETDVFVELDGSFVARNHGPANNTNWQLDGIIGEKNERVSTIELKGTGDPHALADFIFRYVESFVPPQKVLVCEIVEAGWYVEYQQFKSTFLVP